MQMLFVFFVGVFVFVHLDNVVIDEDAAAELADDDVLVNADVKEVLRSECFRAINRLFPTVRTKP